MKTKENEKYKNKINDKIAIFDTNPNYNMHKRKTAVFEINRNDLNSFDKRVQIYQPKKQNDEINLRKTLDTRKLEKKENKYSLKNENKENSKNKKMSKALISSTSNTSSNIEYGKLVKKDISQSYKINEQKVQNKRKTSDNTAVIPQKNDFLEIINKFNQNEDKNKIIKNTNNNSKRKVKSKEKVNKINYNNNRNNENKKYINNSKNQNDINNNTYNNYNNNTFNINRNKNKNSFNNYNNYNKDIKELPNKTLPKENKVLDTVQLFSKNTKKTEQEKNYKINNENKKKNNNIIKDRIAFFSNDNLNKSFEKKMDKNKINEINEENKVNIKYNKEPKKSENINYINNKNSNIYEKKYNKKENFEKCEKLSNKKKPDNKENNPEKKQEKKQEVNVEKNIEKNIEKKQEKNIEKKQEKIIKKDQEKNNEKNNEKNIDKNLEKKQEKNIKKEQEKNIEKDIKSSPKKIIPEPNKIYNIHKKENNINVINNNLFSKKYSKQINQKYFIPKNNSKINEEIEEISIKANKKFRTSNSLPRVKTKSLNDNDIEYINLNKIQINSETKTNSFCKAFFIVSFPKKNNKIVEDSEGILSDCQHEECSCLPAFDPEIIYKYPEKDSKELEINNILASICFPNLIKVCYSDEEDKIYTLKNYRTVFTNQIGDRYFSMMYHFYIRMNNNNFYNIYDCKLFEKLAIKYSGEIDENIEPKTKIINNINSKKYIYIPYCICLISKYPYFSQMEKCLQSIMLTIKDSNFKNNELNEIISYIVNSIPSPYLKTSISFPVPNSSDIIEINPIIYQELYLYGDNKMFLLEKLSVNNLVLLFRLLLFEQKILFISNDYDNLTLLTLNLISLLYPFSWVHIYIPIITEKMLKYLQSFLPFISGMHKNLFEKEKVQDILFSSHKDLFIFDIDNNSFDISCNLAGKKRVNFNKLLNKNVPPFPRGIEELILKQLNILKAYIKKYSITEKNYITINIKIKLLFIQVFIKLLYDYKNYLTIVDDLPVFNTNALLKERPESDSIFYKELTTTQLFQIFIQNSLNYINNKNSDNFLFDELIRRYLNYNNINRNKIIYIILLDEFIKFMKNDYYDINKTYIVKPSQLKFFQKIEMKLNNQKGAKLIQDVNYYLKEMFNYRQYLNENGIVKENKRIVYNDINISNKNDVKSIGYYITEEEKNENEKNKNNIKEEKKKLQNKKDNNKKDNNKKKDNKNVEKDFSDNDDEELSNVEKEDIRDNIRGTLTRVFKSDKVNVVKDSAVLISSLEKEYGRKYFVDIIEGNKNNKEIKILNEDSFKILLEVITKLLLKLNYNRKNIIYTIKVIKSCFYFKTIFNKVDYLLYEKIFEILTKNFNMFNSILFWELWIEDELDEKDIEMINKFKKIKEENTFYYIDEDDEEFIKFKDHYKKQLKEARKNMEIMKLNRSLMLSVVQELCQNNSLEDEFQKEQVVEIMKMNV